MKILHLYKDYPPVRGGIEGHVRLLATRQAELGLDVTVLVSATSRRSTVSEEEGVRVIRAARLATLASTPLSLSLLSWLLRLKPDVAHLHYPYPFGEVAHRLLVRHDHATVVTYHSDIVRQRWLGTLYAPWALRWLNRCDRILVTNPPYLKSSRILRAVRGRCRVVPLGIDPIPFLGARPKTQAELPPGVRGPIVLFVGRLRYYKGLEVLIRAMEEVEADLLVIGSGPMAERWQACAWRSAASRRIHFLGTVDDAELPGYYAASDVLVLPSTERSEAYGLVQLEAMASSTPVVSTELGTGTSFVNRHQETGLIVPPRDSRALADALRQLLNDPAWRQRLGAAGRRRVVSQLNAGTMVERTLEIYRETLAERSAAPLGVDA